MTSTPALLTELVRELPFEPARAIVLFCDRVLSMVVNRPSEKRAGKPEDFAAITTFALKFCAKYKIPVDLPLKGPNTYEHMSQVIGTISSNRSKILSGVIDAEIDNILIEYDTGVGETFGLARLNTDEKKKMHEHIGAIRQLIEASDLSDRKKNALYDRLNDLAKEVDKHGTSTDRFFAFVSNLGFVLGEFGANSKPLFDEVSGMIQSVSRARARQEGISLPAGDEPLRLSPPDAE
jgi:hypothetical protein